MDISAIQQAVNSKIGGRQRLVVSNGKPGTISLSGKPANYHQIQKAIVAIQEATAGKAVTINLEDVLAELRLRKKIQGSKEQG